MTTQFQGAPPDRPRSDPPLVLVVHAEWSGRSLASVLTPRGYRVELAYTTPDALAAAERLRPDAVLVGLGARHIEAVTLCRQLRRHPDLALSTPVLLTLPAPPTARDQREAIRAGASDFWAEPLDAHAVLEGLDAQVRAKREADRLGPDALIDSPSGLYSARGVTRRAGELAQLAGRHHLPLACATFEIPADLPRALADQAARALRASGRVSDAIGRIEPGEFVVYAPATDAAGAAGLVRRLSTAAFGPLGTAVRAGHAVAPAPLDGISDPAELFRRARTGAR